MANMVENLLRIEGESGVLLCLERIRGSGGEPIDFRAIVPIPPALRCAGHPREGQCVSLGDALNDLRVLHQLALESVGIAARFNREKHPGDSEPAPAKAKRAAVYPNHFDFRVARWGTRTNACDAKFCNAPSDREARILFDTAWAPPIPVLEELGRMFPDLTFTCDADMYNDRFEGTITVHGLHVEVGAFTYYE